MNELLKTSSNNNAANTGLRRLQPKIILKHKKADTCYSSEDLAVQCETGHSMPWPDVALQGSKFSMAG